MYIDYVKDYGGNGDDAEYVDTIQQEVSFSVAALVFSHLDCPLHVRKVVSIHVFR